MGHKRAPLGQPDSKARPAPPPTLTSKPRGKCVREDKLEAAKGDHKKTLMEPVKVQMP